MILCSPKVWDESKQQGLSMAQITKERLDEIEKCLNEGWPFLEITKTHKVSYKTLRKYFPGRQWSRHEVAKLGALSRRVLYTS